MDKGENIGRLLRMDASETYDGVPLMNVIAASTNDTLIGFYNPSDFVDKYNLSEIGPKLNETFPVFVPKGCQVHER